MQNLHSISTENKKVTPIHIKLSILNIDSGMKVPNNEVIIFVISVTKIIFILGFLFKT